MASSVKMPGRRNRVSRFIARQILRGIGWKLVGDIPPVPKAVFIAAPHTSNWDGFIMIVGSYAMGIKLSWMGKKSLFKFPLGLLLKALGGVSVDRSQKNDTVQQIADVFAARPSLFLAIAPSASRKKREYWKSGFYHIAVAAQVPLLCGCVDYSKKEVGVIGVINPDGSAHDDMASIRKIYEGRDARFPENVTPMMLRSEVERTDTKPQQK